MQSGSGSELYRDILFRQGLSSMVMGGRFKGGIKNQLKRDYLSSNKMSYNCILSLKRYCTCFAMKLYDIIGASHL